jgi:hypothetical protein
MATDVPQRMADGSLFIPKATQHLLSIRTVITVEAKAPHRESCGSRQRATHGRSVNGELRIAAGSIPRGILNADDVS